MRRVPAPAPPLAHPCPTPRRPLSTPPLPTVPLRPAPRGAPIHQAAHPDGRRPGGGEARAPPRAAAAERCREDPRLERLDVHRHGRAPRRWARLDPDHTQDGGRRALGRGQHRARWASPYRRRSHRRTRRSAHFIGRRCCPKGGQRRCGRRQRWRVGSRAGTRALGGRDEILGGRNPHFAAAAARPDCDADGWSANDHGHSLLGPREAPRIRYPVPMVRLLTGPIAVRVALGHEWLSPFTFFTVL